VNNVEEKTLNPPATEPKGVAADVEDSVAPQPSKQASLLFVDDEQRVLKSMRAMFRREYDVHVANSGAQALEILAEQSIDVVISDQRMPEMTGVEVLSTVKARCPSAVRILLTGYADLAAVEASINEAEVFRYLMKPCSAPEIKEAIEAGLAMDDSVSENVSPPSFNAPDVPQTTAATPKPLVQDERAIAAKASVVELLVLSQDRALQDGVTQACSGHKVNAATSIDEACEVLKNNPVGVLVTDLGIEQSEIDAMTRQFKAIVPELVVILASDRSDANVLIQLINSGQVFRFLLKPIQPGQCKIWLGSALRRFAERGGEALAAIDQAVTEPSFWVRFKNWFLGVQA